MATQKSSRRSDRARSGATGPATLAEGAPAPAIRSVEKRDGRRVPFQVEKIQAAVQAALDAAGEPDPAFAEEVALVCRLTLENEARGRSAVRTGPGGPASPAPYVPHIERIQDLVEKALMELGRPAVAKAYILYRDRRARMREALRVHQEGTRRTPVRVRESEGVSRWTKGRIVAALIEEAELPRDAAEEIAAQVERRVFASGLTRITTALVRELVAGELLERGWTNALDAQRVVGVSRHDVGRLLAGDSLQAWEALDSPGAARSRAAAPVRPAPVRPSVRARISGEILRRHALEEILPEGVGELHRSGDLHVEDLEAPHLPLSLCVAAELLSSGGSSQRSAFTLLDGAAELARSVSRVLVLERPGAVLAPLLRSTRPGSPLGLSGWLASLQAVARAAGIRIELGSSGPRFSAFHARLLEELVEIPPDPHAPGLTLDGHELEDLLGERPDLGPVCDRLFAEGRLLTAWGDDEESYAGPGCRRAHREPGLFSCGGAIALNLPRLARRAGPWREELVQKGTAELVRAALEAARALADFQRDHDAPRHAGLYTRRTYAITPVGLREALLFLGEGTIDPDQGARLLGLVAEAARRFALGSPLVVAPERAFGRRAARRFAWMDERASRASGARQRWLYPDGPDGADGGSLHGTGESLGRLVPYTADLRLSPVADAASGRFEAEVMKTLRTGALSLAGVPGVRDGKDDTPHLSAWRRFEVLRRARTGELSLELFATPQTEDAPSGGPGDEKQHLRPLA